LSRPRRAARSALAALLGAALGAGLALAFVRSRPAGLPAQLAAPHSPFALLAERARAGVVNVHTSKTVVRPAFPFPDAPLPPGLRGWLGPPVTQGVASLGSGFVLSSDGLVLTNDHVVDGVDRVRVVFADGTRAEAEIVGQDAKTDLALLRVARSEGLHPLPLGDSDAILPGDWVVAIGNPFGLDHTVTVGIVSAKGRDLGHGPYDDYIQTDAAMNPGNSGGPLLDLRGEVVGINAAINPEADAIGFAVPINVAKEILPQLRERGRVTRGWLGVSVQPLTPEIADVLGLETSRGALVSQVREGSPAEAADLRRGDVIVAYRGREIADLRELPRAVSATPVGERVEIELVRDGARRRLVARVGELAEAAAGPRPPEERAGVGRYGLEVQEQLGSEGVVVSAVEPGGAAEQAGLRPGDRILEADRRPIQAIADLARVLEGAGPEGALLLVERGGATVFVMLARSG
jgi:serine protease Do